MDDVVDFLSNAEFMEAIPWRDVEYNIPFNVLQLDEVTTVNGKWSTKIIKENHLRAKAYNEKKNMYILKSWIYIYIVDKEKETIVLSDIADALNN